MALVLDFKEGCHIYSLKEQPWRPMLHSAHAKSQSEAYDITHSQYTVSVTNASIHTILAALTLISLALCSTCACITPRSSAFTYSQDTSTCTTSHVGPSNRRGNISAEKNITSG